MPEVTIPRYQGHIGVQTNLRDDHVREFCLAPFRNHLCPKQASPLPESSYDRQERQLPENAGSGLRERGIAEQFAKNDRRKNGLSRPQSDFDSVDIGAIISAKVGN
jgi:hypothetical protein